MFLLNLIGRYTLNFSARIGGFFLFILEIFKSLFSRQFFLKEVLKQCAEIGYYSLPVIGLTALFTGAVLALQTYLGFSRLSAEGAVASVVAISITRELGPVLGGLMLTGRISSSIASELSSMKISDQVNALYTLGVDPIKYLVIPRVIAGMLMTPLLILVADSIGIMGGCIVATQKLGFSTLSYIEDTYSFIQMSDVISGLIKAVIFGAILTSMGCYCGMNALGGAKSVGNATISAVVNSSMLILLFNYITTALMF
ncbi:MlaE family ABC transporter permease [Candidatus Cyrtobacter comes]|nr:ABC transporter permease [Candidatus Cyrtobacter comes]